MYRFLDSIDKVTLSQIAFNFVSSRHPQGISVCFYDVTTLYFETTKEDEFRQKGFSKDHRTDIPQVLIGLFVDSNGFPFDFDVYEGKTFEGHTFVKAVESIRQKYTFPTLTVVADAGMLSKENLDYLDSLRINYIVGARLKNVSQTLAQQILNHQFSHQTIFETIVDNKRLIVDYSAGRAKMDAKNRDRAITKLKQKLADKKPVVRKSKYLLTEGKSEAVGINEDQIKLDQQFDGLKGYFTNKDTVMENPEIITQYHQLWQVEKAFRMSKHDLQERPIYHFLPQRIKAHLTLCFVSLLVMKETEKKLTKINYSLETAIALLGGVGQGPVRIGNIELATESELDPATQLIHNLFLGH
jgi:transposase